MSVPLHRLKKTDIPRSFCIKSRLQVGAPRSEWEVLVVQYLRLVLKLTLCLGCLNLKSVGVGEWNFARETTVFLVNLNVKTKFISCFQRRFGSISEVVFPGIRYFFKFWNLKIFQKSF